MSNMVVAVVKNAQPWQFGFRYFDEADWPQPGYELIKVIEETTVAEMNRLEIEWRCRNTP